jgi:hypothetical protein
MRSYVSLRFCACRRVFAGRDGVVRPDGMVLYERQGGRADMYLALVSVAAAPQRQR